MRNTALGLPSQAASTSSAQYSDFAMPYAYLLVEPNATPGVLLIRLNRPKELNALSTGLMQELVTAVTEADADSGVRCIVLTGSDRAFAAGADIGELANATQLGTVVSDRFEKWEQLRRTKKPLIAAVSGFALGGGCELALLCDTIVASETAQFGQPEIRIGTIPGAGGTQRLTHALGKAKAMQLVLTGQTLSATEALQHGLVCSVVPQDLYLKEALRLAERIAAMPPFAVRMAKAAVNQAFETSLTEGLKSERSHFFLTLGTPDQQEGMAAFLEKRTPKWSVD
jgi:enoyl-CoA hydratase